MAISYENKKDTSSSGSIQSILQLKLISNGHETRTHGEYCNLTTSI